MIVGQSDVFIATLLKMAPSINASVAEFVGLQLCGFVVLVSGTFIYNEVVQLPLMGLWARILPESMIDKRHRKVSVCVAMAVGC